MQITGRNINDVFVDALWQMRVSGVTEDSRNGPVVSIPEPVTLTYLSPRERVLWNERRDANPFFHLLESLWMLAGRDDSTYLCKFNKRMAEYAEEDGRIHGAYGMRWRHAYGIDQLQMIISELRNNPTSRRAVLAMWYATADLGKNYRDLPCNTHVYFRILKGALDMTVCNRSNDFLWGACGANVVHFSMLQEFLANAIGVEVGRYTQFTNNLHLYTEIPMAADFLQNPPEYNFTYDTMEQCQPYPELCVPETYELFLEELPLLMSRQYELLSVPFLIDVALPMQEYYLGRQEGKPDIELLRGMVDCDWKWAALGWVNRRNQDALGRAAAN